MDKPHCHQETASWKRMWAATGDVQDKDDGNEAGTLNAIR